jgi:hypothetical protein
VGTIADPCCNEVLFHDGQIGPHSESAPDLFAPVFGRSIDRTCHAMSHHRYYDSSTKQVKRRLHDAWAAGGDTPPIDVSIDRTLSSVWELVVQKREVTINNSKVSWPASIELARRPFRGYPWEMFSSRQHLMSRRLRPRPLSTRRQMSRSDGWYVTRDVCPPSRPVAPRHATPCHSADMLVFRFELKLISCGGCAPSAALQAADAELLAGDSPLT